MIRRILPLVALLLLVPLPGRAGCLAPADVAIDTGIGPGPFWGNDAGALLYAGPGVNGHATLRLRPLAGPTDPVAVSGERSGFSVGTLSESWDAFSSGTINADGDVAFVASSIPEDDPATPQNEAVSRKGVYARRGGTMRQIARFGNASPARDVLNQPIPWGSIFDAGAADRDANGVLTVIFSAQYASTVDHRLGLFRWTELQPASVTPIVLTGDLSPSGGAFLSFGRIRVNGPGDAAFFAVTQQSEGSPQIPGLYVRRADGASARVVKFGTEGDAAPGGGAFSILGDFDADDAGVVTFAATVAGGPRKTGLFRATPPTYETSLVVGEGDPTPLGGTYGAFASSIVRATNSGETAFEVALSEDVGLNGIFTIAVGTTQALPLVTTSRTLSIAALGAGRAAYASETQIRVVTPSDGSLQGPADFRIVSLDMKNSAPLKTDTIRFEGRFLLPSWTATPPATFRGDASRVTPAATLTGASLAKIAEVKVSVSASPGNNFVFGLSGPDASPAGTLKYNGNAQTVKKLRVAPDGSSATWSWTGLPGPGSLTVNLTAGTFKLSVSAATIQPSYEAPNFRVLFALRSTADVAQARPDDQSYFVRDLRIAGQQPNFGGGRRVTSKGEGTPGGTLFVDSLKVTRKAASKGRPASDSIQLAGTLFLCPGSSAPATPAITATLHVGSFALDAVKLNRVGKSGALYRYAASGTELKIDLAKATFSLKAAAPVLADLVDPVPGSATNGADRAVGGMSLPFTLSIPQAYEATYDVPMVRAKGGKVFSR